MAAIGGSVESVTVDGREFPVTADADATRDIGGWSNESQSNGDGSARLIKTRKVWKMGGLSVEIDDDRGDQEYLQDKADSNDYFPLAFTFASGIVYQGVGQVSGDFAASSQSASAPIEFDGSGKLTQQ